MTDDLQQALDFLRSERQHEEQALVINIHTGHGLEHVWTLLDHIAALETQYVSGEPGTQGATLRAFYAIVETLPEYNPVMSYGHLNVLKDHLAALEARNRQLADVAREMRDFVDHRDMMIVYGDATLAAEKLAAWDTALKALGQERDE
jgi:hypothetical protein